MGLFTCMDPNGPLVPGTPLLFWICSLYKWVQKSSGIPSGGVRWGSVIMATSMILRCICLGWVWDLYDKFMFMGSLVFKKD